MKYNWIRGIMLNHGITIPELAAIAGVSEATALSYYNGKVPGKKTIAKIAQALNLSEGEYDDASLAARLDLKPCPFCGERLDIVLEPNIYPYKNHPARSMYAFKCNSCFARTIWAYKPEDANVFWQAGIFTRESEMLAKDGYVKSPALFLDLLEKVYTIAFEDYKAEVRRCMEHPRRGALEGEHWLMQQSEIAKKTARDQIPYDQWRDKMGCRHCSIREAKCPHKNQYPWRKFKQGKLQYCPRKGSG